MSTGIDKLASELQKVIEEKDKNKKSPYDTEAEVVRVDSDIVWVKIPGGVDETPAQKTVNAKEGDKVQVRVTGGRAFLVGNGTNPPTDDTVANVAIDNARDANQNATAAGRAAEQAIESANTANEKAYEASVAAAQAQTDAGIAHTAAEEAKADAAAANTAATQAKADAAAASTAAGEAKTAANEAKADAQAANTAATEAKADAARANTAANDSLSQLSIVEDVVGTLNWITTHATYKASADAEVHAGKWYFTKSGDTYNVVTNPTGNPSAKGYYEVDTIDEAVSNYVASHLALTNEGLYLTKDGNGYKILLANDGLKVYDPEGHLVSTFGESIILDSSRPQTIGNNNVYIKYYDKNNDGTPDSLAIKADEFLLSSGKTIQEELEGVENWFYSVAPTTSNPPASSWTTDKLKEQHLRDIYFDTTSGKSYRWAKEGTTYKWVEIEDVELAALAKDLHDNYPPRSEFTVAPNKIQSTVSAAQTAATNAANTATDNKLKSYYTKTETDSQITQKANEISLSVAQTEISKIEVGGRNLFIGSNQVDKTASINGLTYIWDKDTLTLTISGTNTEKSKSYGVTMFASTTRNHIYFDKGDTLTYKATLVSGSADGLYLAVNFTNTSGSQYGCGVARIGKSVTYTFGDTHDASKPCASVFIGAYADTGTVDCVLKIKLEKGNKATDWSPAPEDLEAYTDSQVSAAKSEIKVTTDGISTEVSKKVGNSEIISKINQSAETIKIEASKVEIDGTVTFNAIKAKTDAAYDAKGAASAVQTNLNNLQIGGRNLLVGTAKNVSKATTATSSYVIQVLYDTPGQATLSALSFSANDEVTLSFDWKVTSATTYGNARIEWYGEKGSTSMTYIAPLINPFATFSASNTSGHVVTTVKLTSATILSKRIVLRIDNSNLTLTISNLKLEKGNKATDWTPAPEDVWSEIDGIEIGGRNLARGTAEMIKGGGAWSTGTWRDSGASSTYNYTVSDSPVPSVNKGVLVTTKEAKGQYGVAQDHCPMLSKQITFSVWAKGTAGGTIKLQSAWWNGISGSTGNTKIILATGEWQFVSVTTDLTSQSIPNGNCSICYLYWIGTNVNDTCVFVAPKLEYGNKATAWTPAPEDVQAEIDAKKSVHTLNTNYSYSYADILTYSAEGYGGTAGASWSVSSTEGVKQGDTVRLKVTVSDMSNTPVYIIGTVVSITSTTALKAISHGLDTTVIDGGNILTNSIGANKIKVNEISIGQSQVSGLSTALANTQKLYTHTVDLSASTYNQDTWYPVLIGEATESNASIYFKCSFVYGGGTPSWSSHSTKHWGCNVEAVYHISRWGWNSTTSSYIDSYSFGQTSTEPIVLSSDLGHTAYLVVYLRGGGIYPIQTNIADAPQVKTSSYTINSQTVAPKTTQPVNSTDFVISRRETDTKATNAAKTATTYITDIDSKNGIIIKAVNGATSGSDTNKQNYIKLNADGLNIYKGGSSVAFYGDTARIGRQDASHIEMDYHSFQQKDLEGRSYVYFSDLRNEQGEATINLKYTHSSYYQKYNLGYTNMGVLTFYQGNQNPVEWNYRFIGSHIRGSNVSCYVRLIIKGGAYYTYAVGDVLTVDYIYDGVASTFTQTFDETSAGKNTSIKFFEYTDSENLWRVDEYLDNIVSVKINGEPAFGYTSSKTNGTLSVWGTDYLPLNEEFTVSFDCPENENPKAYTLGIRNDDSRIGPLSTALGINNTAAGANSLVGGENNIAQGRSSFAFGEHLTTNNKRQVAFGAYNDPSTIYRPLAAEQEPLFMIGGGSSSNPENSFVITDRGGIMTRNSWSGYGEKALELIDKSIGILSSNWGIVDKTGKYADLKRLVEVLSIDHAIISQKITGVNISTLGSAGPGWYYQSVPTSIHKGIEENAIISMEFAQQISGRIAFFYKNGSQWWVASNTNAAFSNISIIIRHVTRANILTFVPSED